MGRGPAQSTPTCTKPPSLQSGNLLLWLRRLTTSANQTTALPAPVNHLNILGNADAHAAIGRAIAALIKG